jgi:hypothetical protein
VSRQRLIERFPGAIERLQRVYEGSDPGKFGIHRSACRIDLSPAARDLVSLPGTMLRQLVRQFCDNHISHRTGRRFQLSPEVLSEHARPAQIFFAMN